MSENTRPENEKESKTEHKAENKTVTVYGSPECPYTARTRKWLENWGVDYRWVDVDADSGANQQIADWNEGRAIRPTLDVGGAIFVNPEQSDLHYELKSRGLL